MNDEPAHSIQDWERESEASQRRAQERRDFTPERRRPTMIEVLSVALVLVLIVTLAHNLLGFL